MSNKSFAALNGFSDILPSSMPYWEYIEQHAAAWFRAYGFLPIRLPLVETSQLFKRSIGGDTDVVQKEMYEFTDRGNRRICLRPEATASVVRAAVEHNLLTSGECRLYYTGPMFRGERPQAGRQRQFHQCGVEALGTDSAEQDAEIISLAWEFTRALGLRGISLQINTVGCSQDKHAYAEALRLYLQPQLAALCAICQARSERSILRVLDCKNPQCRQLLTAAPRLSDYRCESCTRRYGRVQFLLETLSVPWQENPCLVRGLDYYTDIVFELLQGEPRAQNAVGAGGRYNNLIAELGGPAAGAIGFAFGMERLLLAMHAEQCIPESVRIPEIFFAVLGNAAAAQTLLIARELRQAGMVCWIQFGNDPLKKQLRRAARRQARYVVIIGDEELSRHELILRDMITGTQSTHAISRIRNTLEELGCAALQSAPPKVCF